MMNREQLARWYAITHDDNDVYVDESGRHSVMRVRSNGMAQSTTMLLMP